MRIIAVIPAYNEKKHIKEIIKETKKYVDQVIVVDDGSRDNTFRESKKGKALTLKHVINLGKGLALKTGCEKAIQIGDIIVTLDADSQHDPAEIPKLIQILKKENLDLVIGSRPLDKNMPYLPKFGNWIINGISRILFGIDIKDTQSGFRVFTKEAYNRIEWQSSRYFVETEMIINAKNHGLRYKEVPIKTIYHSNYKGTTVIDGIRIVGNMFCWKTKNLFWRIIKG